jgi:hypothetical protein
MIVGVGMGRALERRLLFIVIRDLRFGEYWRDLGFNEISGEDREILCVKFGRRRIFFEWRAAF